MKIQHKPDYFALFDALGYIFKKKSHLLQALTHRSASKENNERLEYLGDSILNFCIADILFKRFPNMDEGVLTRMRANLVRKETLANVAAELKLNDYLILGIGEIKTGGVFRHSILADTLEALCAAIYIDDDENMATVRTVLSKLFAEKISGLDEELDIKDPKTALQEYLQKHKMDLPIYEVLEITGPDHAQNFKVSCIVKRGKIADQTTAEGGSLRKAEQLAAKEFLDMYCHD
jgi:ribonuclease-3